MLKEPLSEARNDRSRSDKAGDVPDTETKRRTETRGDDAQAGSNEIDTVPRFSVPTTVSPRPVPEGADLDNPALYFNRELSWIDFNWRVLYQALDTRLPLLERVRFIAITASNLDEFVQKRVGGLKRQEAAGVRKLSPDGRTPIQQLALLREAVLTMQQALTEAWENQLKPALRTHAGVVIYDYEDLDQKQRAAMQEYFRTQIYPILTPLAVDPGRPFPFISNLSLSLAITVRHPKEDTVHFARLKVPSNLQRWLPVCGEDMGDNTLCFIPVEQLITHHIEELFYGMEVVSVHAFRITRNADLRRAEEEADDLLAMISEELRERRFAPVVRLEVAKDMPADVRRILMRELGLQQEDMYELDGLLDLTGCFQIADLDLPKFRFAPWEPVVPRRLSGGERETPEDRDIFAIIREGDLLVHHPYDSFEASVQRLIEEAAADPQVLAIKQTLYRTSDQSPVVKALVQAAERGKQVAVLVEVKARFDEANNIEWGRMMEDSGIHVAYGLVGLKTHAKVVLIVRKERDELRTYCHIGTGNYHSKTARLYTDLGLLTCSPELGQDAVNLFHYLTGYSADQSYGKAIVAPLTMRDEFYRLIRQEAQFQKSHGNGRIMAKMNALDDVGVIQELYAASQAGVEIDLIIRGHCLLRPGLEGYGENIRVISILGRFLEHDRIFYFHNNGHPLTFLGSADWRRRNLSERVELVSPVEEPVLQRRLISILEDALSDNRLAWDLDADGNYVQRHSGPEEEERNFHQILMQQALDRVQSAAL